MVNPLSFFRSSRKKATELEDDELLTAPEALQGIVDDAEAVEVFELPDSGDAPNDDLGSEVSAPPDTVWSPPVPARAPTGVVPPSIPTTAAPPDPAVPSIPTGIVPTPQTGSPTPVHAGQVPAAPQRRTIGTLIERSEARALVQQPAVGIPDPPANESVTMETTAGQSAEPSRRAPEPMAQQGEGPAPADASVQPSIQAEPAAAEVVLESPIEPTTAAVVVESPVEPPPVEVVVQRPIEPPPVEVFMESSAPPPPAAVAQPTDRLQQQAAAGPPAPNAPQTETPAASGMVAETPAEAAVAAEPTIEIVEETRAPAQPWSEMPAKPPANVSVTVEPVIEAPAPTRTSEPVKSPAARSVASFLADSQAPAAQPPLQPAENPVPIPQPDSPVSEIVPDEVDLDVEQAVETASRVAEAAPMAEVPAAELDAIPVVVTESAAEAETLIEPVAQSEPAAKQVRIQQQIADLVRPEDLRASALAATRAIYSEALQAVGRFFSAASKSKKSKAAALPIGEVETAAAKLVSGMSREHVGDGLVAAAVGAYPDEGSFIVPHSVNVAVLSQRVAGQLGLEGLELETLAIAGLLHDVGTVRIPRETFYKDDSLSNDQWVLMRQRPTFSAEIIRGLGPAYRAVAEISHQVHERLDGNGYPRGLHVDTIALEASILGAVDIFEAFIHPRPYKKTVPAAAMYGVDNLMRLSHQFGDGVLKALVRSVGLFPVGTCVRLNSGEVARVLRGRSTNPMRPEVEVVYDTQKRHLKKPRYVDLMATPHLYVFKPLSPEDLAEFGLK